MTGKLFSSFPRNYSALKCISRPLSRILVKRFSVSKRYSTIFYLFISFRIDSANKTRKSSTNKEEVVINCLRRIEFKLFSSYVSGQTPHTVCRLYSLCTPRRLTKRNSSCLLVSVTHLLLQFLYSSVKPRFCCCCCWKNLGLILFDRWLENCDKRI